MKKCIYCEKEIKGAVIRAFNGRGGFENSCSRKCADAYEDITNKRFEKELELYRSLNNDVAILENKESKTQEELIEITQKKEDIESLEYTNGFTKEML